VLLWWYGLGYALGFLEIHLFLGHVHRQLQMSRRDVWTLTLFVTCGRCRRNAWLSGSCWRSA
jgi:hypothetical protein